MNANLFKFDGKSIFTLHEWKMEMTLNWSGSPWKLLTFLSSWLDIISNMIERKECFANVNRRAILGLSNKKSLSASPHDIFNNIIGMRKLTFSFIRTYYHSEAFAIQYIYIKCCSSDPPKDYSSTQIAAICMNLNPKCKPIPIHFSCLKLRSQISCSLRFNAKTNLPTGIAFKHRIFTGTELKVFWQEDCLGFTSSIDFSFVLVSADIVLQSLIWSEFNCRFFNFVFVEFGSGCHSCIIWSSKFYEK